jgi:hypothetical protein
VSQGPFTLPFFLGRQYVFSAIKSLNLSQPRESTRFVLVWVHLDLDVDDSFSGSLWTCLYLGLFKKCYIDKRINLL